MVIKKKNREKKYPSCQNSSVKNVRITLLAIDRNTLYKVKLNDALNVDRGRLTTFFTNFPHAQLHFP